MKKISKTIAMILVLVMLASSFTGCLSWWLMTGEPLDIGNVSGEGLLLLIFLPVIDVILLPIALTVVIIRTGIEAARDNRGKKWDGIDTFSAAITSLPDSEFNSLMHTFDPLPDSELNSLAGKFYSLPEAEIDSYSQILKTFSQKEIAAMTSALNNLPEAKLTSLIETLNSMPEEKLISTMNKLQYAKFRYQNKRSGL